MSTSCAEPRVVSPKSAAVVPTAQLDLLNPVALLGHALASLVGANSIQSDNARYAVALAGPLFPQAIDFPIRFAPAPEHNRVSLVLAESQVRIRLAHDVSLRCEVSSLDDSNADAELKLALGVQFKFK
jgi:hypothetical protein